jgi:hypothetical protein
LVPCTDISLRHTQHQSTPFEWLQTIRDGKSVIIEGMHIDPGLYLYEFGRYGLHHLQGGLPRGDGGPPPTTHPIKTLSKVQSNASDSDTFSPTSER